jgi:ADP-ribosylglycohydrolase
MNAAYTSAAHKLRPACGASANWKRLFDGILLGTAVGDALGLPAENLSPRRIKRLWKNEWRMRFVFGRGMISDDTEHTLMVAQAMLAHGDDVTSFQRALAWKFRWWFLALPAGVGLATARACLKLWLGFPPSRSGVVSGGCGPAMRSAIIGAFFAEKPKERKEFVRASSRLTHRGWQAETAALAVAEIVALIATDDQHALRNSEVVLMLRTLSGEVEWHKTLSHMEQALDASESVAEFAHRLGLQNGVTGYSLHTVPIAIYAWMRHAANFRTAMTEALSCGGDTDTVGAILGALCCASGGPESIPSEWINRIWDWPRSVNFMRRLTNALAEQKHTAQTLGPVRYFWPGVIPRNILFLVVVLIHGLRRLTGVY